MDLSAGLVWPIGHLLALGMLMALWSPTPVSTIQYCGQPANATASTSTRWSRVRTWGCVEVDGDMVRGIGRAEVDKPTDCYTGVPPGCPVTSRNLWAEFTSFEMTVKYNGRAYRCRYPGIGGHSADFTCDMPTAGEHGSNVIETQMCFDVKDDGQDTKCTPFSRFERTV